MPIQCNTQPMEFESQDAASTGAGIPGAQGPRIDRRFPPLGVKAVPSYQCATDKDLVAHVGGACF